MTALFERINTDWKGQARIAQACVSICDFLGRTDLSLVEELSFLELKKIASAEDQLTDAEVALAIQYLTGVGIGVLGIRCYFNDGEQEYLIPDNEYISALNTGLMAHPMTGEEIEDPSHYLFPWFIPGRIFREGA